MRKTPFPYPCSPFLPPTVKEDRKVPLEITSSLRRLIITHNDHSTIHFALKLIHHVENDIVLIYHKIYETCTPPLFLMRFMQMLLLPLFVFLKVLAGKWGPAQRAEALPLLKGWWGRAFGSRPGRAPKEQALHQSFLSTPS